MKIAGEYRFDAPRQAVWEALRDPTVLASVLPGCEKLEQLGEDSYEGSLNIKVGPVQGKFGGKIRLEDVDPPNGYTMQIDGRGGPGFVKATGRIALTDDGEGTSMAYDSDAQVGGRIAGVGQRLLDSSAKAIIKQSLEGLNSALQARQGGEEDAGEAAAAEAPSQTDFAVGVAKEVARDLVPKPVWIGGAILLAAVVLILLFG